MMAESIFAGVSIWPTVAACQASSSCAVGVTCVGANTELLLSANKIALLTCGTNDGTAVAGALIVCESEDVAMGKEESEMRES